MKSILFFITAYFFIIQPATSQQGIVRYGHIESLGKGGPVGLDFNAFLLFDKNQTYYVTAKDSLENSSNLEGQKLEKKNNSENKEVYLGKHTLAKGKQVYFDRKKDSLWWNVKYGSIIYGKEDRPAINWKLQNDTKKIGNIICKKATAEFRGRNYTVWYTEKIPLPYGPWKFQGLPGLVLEAYDTNKELYIYFKSINYPLDKKQPVPKIINPNGNDDWVSIPEYKKLLEKFVDKGKTKALLLSKKLGDGINVKAGEMDELCLEIF
ncbi:GLPGLI family protein [Mesonia ostreae]|uniref:GLPGLI family protein n=1 Tax=Mesonia ostreae TaxID=861110 RepID=A0ABU2KIE7_9FLAO|nr:GLPGLI family protein [Mesonia ostreae]MDT0294478.1 GLPGLI family protein [Mesonia ostreae]